MEVNLGFYVQKGWLRFRRKVENPLGYFVERFSALAVIALPVEIAPVHIRLQPVLPVRLRCGLDAYLIVRLKDAERLNKASQLKRTSFLNALREHMLFPFRLGNCVDSSKLIRSPLYFPFIQSESFWRSVGYDSVPKICAIYLPIEILPSEKQLDVLVASALDHLSAFYFEFQSGKRTWFSEAVSFFDDPIMFLPVRLKFSQLTLVTEPVFALGLELEPADKLRELARKYLLKSENTLFWWLYASARIIRTFIEMLDSQVHAKDLLEHFSKRVESHLRKFGHNIDLDEVYLPAHEVLKQNATR